MARPEDYWSLLREAAFSYAEHGWPVLPGVRPRHRRSDQWPVPDCDLSAYHGPMGTNDVARSWQRQPYAVLLGCGHHCFDVVRVRQPLATHVLLRLTELSQRGPVAALPGEQWLFFVAAGEPPARELLGRTERYYGAGCWLPAPPTRIGNCALTWRVEPHTVGWQLFRSEVFHLALRAVQPQRRRRRRHTQ